MSSGKIIIDKRRSVLYTWLPAVALLASLQVNHVRSAPIGDQTLDLPPLELFGLGGRTQKFIWSEPNDKSICLVDWSDPDSELQPLVTSECAERGERVDIGEYWMLGKNNTAEDKDKDFEGLIGSAGTGKCMRWKPEAPSEISNPSSYNDSTTYGDFTSEKCDESDEYQWFQLDNYLEKGSLHGIVPKKWNRQCPEGMEATVLAGRTPGSTAFGCGRGLWYNPPISADWGWFFWNITSQHVEEFRADNSKSSYQMIQCCLSDEATKNDIYSVGGTNRPAPVNKRGLFNKFKSKAKVAVDKAKDGVVDGVNKAKDNVKNVKEGLDKAKGDIQKVVGDIKEVAKDKVDDVNEARKEILEKLNQAKDDVGYFLQDKVDDGLNKIKDNAQQISNNVVTITSNIGDAAKEGAEKAKDKANLKGIEDKVKKKIKEGKDIAKIAKGNIGDVVGNIPQVLKDGAIQIANDNIDIKVLKVPVTKAVDKINANVDRIQDEVRDAVDELEKSIRDGIKEIGETTKGQVDNRLFKSIVDGVVDRITAAADQSVTKARTEVDKVLDSTLGEAARNVERFTNKVQTTVDEIENIEDLAHFVGDVIDKTYEGSDEIMVKAAGRQSHCLGSRENSKEVFLDECECTPGDCKGNNVNHPTPKFQWVFSGNIVSLPKKAERPSFFTGTIRNSAVNLCLQFVRGGGVVPEYSDKPQPGILGRVELRPCVTREANAEDNDAQQWLIWLYGDGNSFTRYEVIPKI
ncbi:hypothetical protein DRE_06063 [Drechslerella stenobrocha 248]|uniref:Uncharacterized protein n=1 Tax=Drechslerella stenobrocha 248 TaxID=1043628 RepID=W7I847_9PEZI|nr:hypothetical protein DRE_06063 [Drechslerella stenobrocha 248]